MVHNLKLGFKSGGSRSRQDLDELDDDDDLDCVGDDSDVLETTEGAGLSPVSSLSSLSDSRGPGIPTASRRRKLNKVRACY